MKNTQMMILLIGTQNQHRANPLRAVVSGSPSPCRYYAERF